jgi:hypothetical protein
MRFGSVCSGIEAASMAWNPLGWRAQFLSEIDKFPCALLEQRHPTVPNFGDMTKFKDWPDAAIDVLVGGTPCQSFSVAGLRKGLDDPRGNLMLTYLAIAARYRPQWLVWENVPGVLSSGGGETSEVSSLAWANSGMGGPTECLTLSTSTWPSDASVCSLSDVLEAGSVPQRYFLSARACAGILRRAAKREKNLPARLQAALAAVVASQTTITQQTI